MSLKFSLLMELTIIMMGWNTILDSNESIYMKIFFYQIFAICFIFHYFFFNFNK